jgi:hypothetical protein
MKIEFIFEDRTIVLDQDDKAAIAARIAADYDRWNGARRSQLDDARVIREAIYRKNPSMQSWQSQIKLPDIYELAQTLKAHLWENIYSNPEGMFDVSGRSSEAQAFANVQKATLVNAFDDMQVQSELENAVNHLIEMGDCTLFVGWETKTKEIRRRKTINESVCAHSGVELADDSVKNTFMIEQKLCFDGPKVRAIDPESFVFDVSKKSNWDNCPKIYRSWATIEDIKSDKVYTVTDETAQTLDTLITCAYYNPENASDKVVNGDQIEILELWGDFKLDDGTMLRNWLVTVAGRCSVIRFEANPYVCNPFIYAGFIEDPETKRGISPLRVALILNDISSDILNRQLDALSLITNPPYLAPKGCFNGKQEVSPGTIIEYESALMPQAPIPLKFDSALQGWEFIHFFKGSVESSTGVFKNMVGNTEPAKRTATEIAYTAGGQSTRLLMAIDSINQKLVLPMIEKVADLIANFRFGSESVFVRVNGKLLSVEVGDTLRQADYKYTYGDRRATQDRKLRFKELFDVINGFARIQEVSERVDWVECFKYALEQYGIENSGQFLKES